MLYSSTRGNCNDLSFIDVLLNGLASDGGLYLPNTWPQISKEELESYKNLPYTDVCFNVVKKFIGDEIPENDLKLIIEKSYKDFKSDKIAPTHEIANDIYLTELFHGPTFAFKDFALQFLGNTFDYVLNKMNRKVTIVGATSGDTGSAAIHACKNTSNINILILHPYKKTSDIQRHQMTTVIRDNVHNIALKGSFDDCQDIVKNLFNDKEFKNAHNISAVNSINWVRIMAQIVYYVYTYSNIEHNGKDVSVCVPTGNFGNIFAAYAAKKMGIPFKRFIVASNENDILTRFLQNNDMSTSTVVETPSPSMDIQISSNFERAIFEVSGRDSAAINKMYAEFKEANKLNVSDELWKKITDEFIGFSLSNDDCVSAIKNWLDETGETIDPHTVIGLEASRHLIKDNEIIISMATAHPAKFPEVVEKAIGQKPVIPQDLVNVMTMEEKYDIVDNDVNLIKNYIENFNS